MADDFKPKQMTNAERDHVMYEAVLRLDKLEKAHNNLAMFSQKMSALTYALLQNQPLPFDRLVQDAMNGEIIKSVGERLAAEEMKIIAAMEQKKKEGVV